MDILLGPLSGDEGIAVANYAKTQPNVVFVNGTSGAQSTTLTVKAPNFFRFGGDGAQWMAGLGAYAYKTLHWKSAAILGEDYSYPYTQAAGFVKEFCSLGGNVTKRIWVPLGTTDWSSFVRQLPRDVYGIVLLTGGIGHDRRREGLRGTRREPGQEHARRVVGDGPDVVQRRHRPRRAWRAARPFRSAARRPHGRATSTDS